MLDREMHKRTQSKLHIRRNLSVSQAGFKKPPKDRNLSENPSRANMLQTSHIEHSYTENPEKVKPSTGDIVTSDPSLNNFRTEEPKVPIEAHQEPYNNMPKIVNNSKLYHFIK